MGKEKRAACSRGLVGGLLDDLVSELEAVVEVVQSRAGGRGASSAQHHQGDGLTPLFGLVSMGVMVCGAQSPPGKPPASIDAILDGLQ